MTEFWNDIIPRIIGIIAAFLVTWFAGRGIKLDEKEVTALFVTIYAIVHRAFTAGRDGARAARFRALGASRATRPRDD